jgi:hypothetical protein
MRTKSSTPPRFYILLKLHKQGSPGRPIVSTINSIGSIFSVFLKNILNNLIDYTKYNVKNSTDLKSRLDDIILRNEERLVSFDV